MRGQLILLNSPTARRPTKCLSGKIYCFKIVAWTVASRVNEYAEITILNRKILIVW